MEFQLDPTEEDLAANESGFVLSGFSMQGAEYSAEERSIKLTESLGSGLPLVNLKWVHRSTVDAAAACGYPRAAHAPRGLSLTPPA